MFLRPLTVMHSLLLVCTADSILFSSLNSAVTLIITSITFHRGFLVYSGLLICNTQLTQWLLLNVEHSRFDPVFSVFLPLRLLCRQRSATDHHWNFSVLFFGSIFHRIILEMITKSVYSSWLTQWPCHSLDGLSRRSSRCLSWLCRYCGGWARETGRCWDKSTGYDHRGREAPCTCSRPTRKQTGKVKDTAGAGSEQISRSWLDLGC